jgi:hypothetical protein
MVWEPDPSGLAPTTMLPVEFSGGGGIGGGGILTSS